MGPDIRDVGHPGPIWRINLELAVQLVLGDDRGLATVPSGTPPVADLGCDPCKARSRATRLGEHASP